MLEDALAVWREDAEIQDERELAAMVHLASAYKANGRPVDAIALLEDALAGQKASLGAEDATTLATMNSLAAASRDAGRIDDAIQLHGDVLEIQEDSLGGDHPDTLTSLNNLAVAHHSAGQLDQAVALYRRALESMKSVLSDDDPLTLNTQVNLSAALRSSGEMQEGLNLLAMAATQRALKLGEHHPDTVMTMNALGIAFLAAGQAEEAKPILEATLAQAAETFGPASEAVFQGERNLAMVEAALGEVEASIERLEAALGRANEQLGRTSPVTLGLAAAVMAQLARSDDTDRAQDAAAEWIALIEETLGSGHPDLQECFAALQDLWSRHERWPEAVTMAAGGVRARTAVFGPVHPEVAKARVSHATCLLRCTDHLAAERELRDALPTLDADDLLAWDAAVARSLLAASILGDLGVSGDFDAGLAQTRLLEAEELLEHSRTVFEISSTESDATLAGSLVETYERLAQVCDMTGRPDEAREWRARARPASPKVADAGE
jgi:tetratricopeptide (TPR) repeat protein